MSQFILAYHGGYDPGNEEERKQMRQEWEAWFKGLGSDVLNPGSPLGQSQTVSADSVEDHGGSNPLTGFSIVKAKSMSAALEMAKACPFLKMGTIEVAEILHMTN